MTPGPPKWSNLAPRRVPTTGLEHLGLSKQSLPDKYDVSNPSETNSRTSSVAFVSDKFGRIPSCAQPGAHGISLRTMDDAAPVIIHEGRHVGKPSPLAVEPFQPRARMQRVNTWGGMPMAIKSPARTSSGKAKTRQSHTPRGDIQGLRALAVLAVVVDHLVGWPSGGFVGVDVFFVISGFLITGLLLRRIQGTDSISLKQFYGDFYRKRAKRILPAATLVLIVTVFASRLIFNGPRAEQTFNDAISGFFFVANWRFAAVGTDYFQADGPLSPLRHYWSLGVEEQFYVVWPLLLLVIFVLARRSSLSVKSTMRFVGIVMLLITIGSYAWATYESVNSPTWAYFSTFSRAWELGIGALGAVFASSFARIPSILRPMLGWLGLIGIVASLFLISADDLFPAPGALLPVLATVLVIIAGTGGKQRFLYPLDNPVARHLGDISFSLYLWHFPIIILGAAKFGDSPLILGMLALATLAAAEFSYRLVENPLRTRTWLPATRTDRRPSSEPRLSLQYQITALALLFVLTGSLAAAALTPPQHTAEAQTVEVPTADPTEAPTSPELASLQTEMAEAINAATYPDNLSPTMDEALTQPVTDRDVRACGDVGTLVDRAACTWGNPDATKTAIIVGDSVSMTYVGALRVLLPTDWKLTSMGTFACPFTDFDRPEPLGTECVDRKADAVNAINAIKPDIVFVANSYWPSALSGDDKAPSAGKWQENISTLAEKFSDSAGKVVYISAPPSARRPSECYNPGTAPADCASGIPGSWNDLATVERNVAANIGGAWVDSSPWFCFQNVCPIFVGTIPARSDLTHMTTQYALRIAPVIAETFSEQGIWEPETE
jgi:peptidoglycan/LPS O-acetylase OafA/YrhL